MFCGYACVVYAMRGQYETAAPFIGFAIVLDILDGRIARLTGTASAFGVEFDSLADVISFGIAPATVFAYPAGLDDYRQALPALAMVLLPAVLMVSTIRFRSFKTIDLRTRRPYTVLLLFAAGIMLVTTHPRYVLVAMAYSYLASAFIGLAITRLRHRGDRN